MDEACEQVKVRTRRYAKRQLSWFRNDRRVRWVDASDTDTTVTQILDELARPCDGEDAR